MKLILALLMLSVASAFSADDESSLSGGELRQRAYAEYQRVDAELEKLFQKTMEDEKSPALREALLAAHRAWKLFREADGHYESVLGEGGSDRTYYVNKRMTYLTRQRIEQLATSFTAGWKVLEPVRHLFKGKES